MYFVAITLDPENDSVSKLNYLADAQGVSAPMFQFLTGDCVEVNHVLDKIGLERFRDENGVIQHTNLYLVIDRTGKVAYRFSLGELQEDWLVEALKLVCAEQEPAYAP